MSTLDVQEPQSTLRSLPQPPQRRGASLVEPTPTHRKVSAVAMDPRAWFGDLTGYFVYILFIATLGPLLFGFHLVRCYPLLGSWFVCTLLTTPVRTQRARGCHPLQEEVHHLDRRQRGCDIEPATMHRDDANPVGRCGLHVHTWRTHRCPVGSASCRQIRPPQGHADDDAVLHHRPRV